MLLHRSLVQITVRIFELAYLTDIDDLGGRGLFGTLVKRNLLVYIRSLTDSHKVISILHFKEHFLIVGEADKLFLKRDLAQDLATYHHEEQVSITIKLNRDLA